MTTDLNTGDDSTVAEPEHNTRLKFSSYQKLVVALLAFLQFSIILDFMIISPLGAIIMPDLGIGPQRFGEIVSAYAFSAGISGIVAAGFADRFDRKRFRCSSISVSLSVPRSAHSRRIITCYITPGPHRDRVVWRRHRARRSCHDAYSIIPFRLASLA